MSIALQIIRELQVLVGKVNGLNPQAEEKGGYFCLISPPVTKAVPTLVVRVGEVNELHAHDHFEWCQRVASQLRSEPTDCLTSSAIGDRWDGAVRAANGAIVAFSGYDAPWNELLMLALCAKMGWLDLSQALTFASDDYQGKLKALFE